MKQASLLTVASAMVASLSTYAATSSHRDFSQVAVSGMNLEIAPGDDFSGFANGGWEAATTIPSDHINWSSFSQMTEDNWKKMSQLYQDAANSSSASSAAAKRVGDYYVAQLDEAGIEAKGLAPIQPVLDQIAALNNKTELAQFLGTRLRVDVDPLDLGNFESGGSLFGLWVAPGLHDPEHYMPYLLQGGLGMISASLYLPGNPEQKLIQDKYRNYIAAMLDKAGIANADSKADKIIALEMGIAKVHAPAQESADPVKADHVWQRADFVTRAKGLDWNAYFAAAGLPAQTSFGVWQPKAISGISALVAATPLDVWQDYLSFHAINKSARFLPNNLAGQFFAFYDSLFLGPSQHFPRWIHAVNQTNTFMPGAGQLFAEHYFSAQAKVKVQQIVGNIVAAYARHIDDARWMTAATRQAAKDKLNAMTISVGYPDKWRDSSGLEIKADDAAGNVLRAEAFNNRYELAKLGQPVDRQEWILGAELFGFNLMPLQNALTIPVFELQAPLFDPQAPDAANYAAIGVKIAHFISLALNNEGQQFDAKGRLRNWSSKTDQAHLKAFSAPLVKQYSLYKPFPDLAVNGQQTLNQNIADLTGVQIAYDAYHKALMDKHEQQDIKIADQRFFIAYAQSFRNKDSELALRGQTAASPVAPARYRVATVRNLDAWYRAFDVRAGQGLYLAPNERVKIW